MSQLINQSYRRRSSQLIMAFEGWFVNVVERDLEANKDQYAFPEGFIRMQKLELVRSDGRQIPIQRFERHDDFKPAQGEVGDQYLPNYRMLGNGFILEPGPLETVSDGLLMEYAGTPAELTADTDQLHPSFPEIFEELIVLDAVVYAMDSEGAMESGQLRSLLRQRAEWEADWDRFIDQRTVARQEIDPFIGHYHDA